MSDNFFTGENPAEIQQLRDGLDSNDPAKRKEAAKRVISLKRSGENVQSLFSSMLRCVTTNDMEIKKLVYLYLITYSVNEPEQAIMAVSAFIKDSQDQNPVIRALAVRTMCRIKIDTVAENMLLPLKTCLADRDPYVRKTAAFGVSKLYEVVPDSVEGTGLISELQKLVSDENPLVVTNALQALFEINSMRSTPVFALKEENVQNVLNAVSFSNEWCQPTLFDALATYIPKNSEDAQFIVDRLVPFLRHKNPAVVIGSFKNIYHFMDVGNLPVKPIFEQIIPPYITLVSNSDPEVQFIVLRTLSLFVIKYPNALAKEIRVFFCKYNDKSYVKIQKLDIIVSICTPSTAQMVLDELAEYCNGVDVGFVRKTISSIGQIALKIQASAQRCVEILVKLVVQKVPYVVEESIIVVCDLLRKFPGHFDSIISTFCEKIDVIQTPKAKSAAIWIIGEYCSIINKVELLFDPFVDSFSEEQPLVQLQILSSLVKLYLHNPDETREQLQFVLNEATKVSVSPDVRNRAMIYWHLLSTDIETAKQILLFAKDGAEHAGLQFDESVLKILIDNMGSISGVLHITPKEFASRTLYSPEAAE